MVLLSSINIYGQHISYSYDNAGNRILRELRINRQRSSENTNDQLAFSTELLSDRVIKIYPNPTKGLVRVEVQGYDNDYGSLRIFSMSGQQVAYSIIESVMTDIDISSCPHGVYLFNIELNGNNSTWKIIKE